MPTASPTVESLTSTKFGGPPTKLSEHEADLARRAAVREKKRRLLDECLDPKTAAECELRKPVYEFTVVAKFRRPDAKGKMTTYDINETVIAQNEADAWAIACDKSKQWPGPRSCLIREITRGEKVDALKALVQNIDPWGPYRP